MPIGKYKSTSTNQKIHIGNITRKNTIRRIHNGKHKSESYKSDEQAEKVQIGRTIGKIQIGAIYNIAT